MSQEWEDTSWFRWPPWMVRGGELTAQWSDSLWVDIWGYKLARWFQQQTSTACDEFLTRSKDRGCCGGLWVSPTTSYAWHREHKNFMTWGEALQRPAARGRPSSLALGCPGHLTVTLKCVMFSCGCYVGKWEQIRGPPSGSREAAQNCSRAEEGTMQRLWLPMMWVSATQWVRTDGSGRSLLSAYLFFLLVSLLIITKKLERIMYFSFSYKWTDFWLVYFPKWLGLILTVSHSIMMISIKSEARKEVNRW